jgi:hypothetical protein
MNEAAVEELKDFIVRQVGVVSSEVRELRGDIEDLHGKFSELQSAVDHYVVRAERLADEQLVIKHQMDRHERWLKQLAKKTGAQLDYAA